MKYGLVIGAGLMLATSTAAFAGTMILEDSFTGQGVKKGGYGDGFRHNGTWRMNLHEETAGSGALRLETRGDWGNGGVISNDVADVWNATGATFTWRAGQAEFTKGDNGLVAEMALLNDSMKNAGYAIEYHNKKGGVYVKLGYNADGSTVGGIFVATDDPGSADSGTAKTRVASFSVGSGFNNATDWIETSLFINDQGFSVNLSEDITWLDGVDGFNASGNAGTLMWDDFNSLGAGTFGNAEFGDGVRMAALGSSGQTRGSHRYDYMSAQVGGSFASGGGGSIPEPASLALLAGGGLLMLQHRPRQRGNA